MNNKIEIFESYPIPKAVFALAIPTIISQLVTVLYNVADTFFIGKLSDPVYMASMMVAYPAFFFLSGFSGLFGIGGASLMSRSLGEKKYERASEVTTFCFWNAIMFSLAYALILFVFKTPLLNLLGSIPETFDGAYKYLLWTTILGAIPTVLNPTLSHLVRAEGATKQASRGITMGCLLNVVLDPLFMFPLKMGLTGAAVATMLSNVIATLYYLIYIFKHRKTTYIKLKPSFSCFKKEYYSEVLAVGLPSFVSGASATISNVVLTNLTIAFSTEAIAGIGIAKKIDMIAFVIAMGFSQSVLPLIGYCNAAKLRKRVKDAFFFTAKLSVAVECVIMAILLLFSTPLSRAFIDNALTIEYSATFLRILALVCPFTAISFLIIAYFQATGKKLVPFIMSMLRKGVIDIPFMFLLSNMIGVYGLGWATPAAEWIGFVISVVLFIKPYKELSAEITADETVKESNS